MEITNPIHPLVGKRLRVRRVRKRGGLLWVCLDHPDGGPLTIGAEATDLAEHLPIDEKMSVPAEGTLLDAFRLGRLVSVVERLKKSSAADRNC